MCGFVGYVNREKIVNDSKKLISFFNQGLFCDSLRGKHGTGVLGVNDKGEVSVYKRALSAPDFLELTATKKIVDSTSNVFMVGHNRWATRGNHTSDNTHPFTHDHVTLFHNGTIDYDQGLNKGKSFDVDSDSVAHFLSKEDDIVKALGTVQGTYSLVWYDDLTESLNFARNKDRPMFFGKIKNSESFVFASEPGMIYWLASRNALELENVSETKAETWIKIPLDPDENIERIPFKAKESVTYLYYRNDYRQVVKKEVVGVNKKEVVGVNKKEVVGVNKKDNEVVTGVIKAWIPYNTTSFKTKHNGYFVVKLSDSSQVNLPGYGEDCIDTYLGKKIKVGIYHIASSGVKYGKFISFENVISVGKKYKGPAFSLVTLEEYKELTKNRCHCCGSEVDENDHEDLEWLSKDEFECATCASFNKRYLGNN